MLISLLLFLLIDLLFGLDGRFEAINLAQGITRVQGCLLHRVA